MIGIKSNLRYSAYRKLICNVIFLLYLSDVKSFELNPSQYDRFTFATYYCQYAKNCIHGGNKVCGYDEHEAFLAQFDDLCTFYKTNCHGVGMFIVIKQVVCDVKKKYLAQHGEEFEWIHVNNSTTPGPIVVRRKNRNKIWKLLHLIKNQNRKRGSQAQGAILLNSSVLRSVSALEFIRDTNDIELKKTLSNKRNTTLESAVTAKEVSWPYKDPRLLKQFVGYHCWRLKHFCTPGGPEICSFEPNVKQYVRCADLCTFHKINCGAKMGYYKPVNASECPEGSPFVNTSYDPYDFKSSSTRRTIFQNETHTWEPPTRTNIDKSLKLFNTAIHHFFNMISNLTLFKPI